MNRREEYRELLEDLERTPPALEYTLQRALAKKKAGKRRRFVLIPAGSLITCLVTFVLLVNLLPTFAYACGRVPLLRGLAKTVAWSPSLSAAVENAYVQPVELEQTANGITLRMEYLIVDQKQVNLFYTLDSRVYGTLGADLARSTDLEGYSQIGGAYDVPNGELRQETLDFMDGTLPAELTLTYNVYEIHPSDETAEPPEQSAEDSMMEEPRLEKPDVLATFPFTLHLDPYFTAQGETLAVNQTFTLDGQTLTLTDAELYPTHMRLNIGDSDDNTAWLQGLDFYLENERGEQFHPITNGIVSTGEEGSPAMVSFRLESSFFSESERLTLHITGAQWLEKNRQRIRLDLTTGEGDPLPDGVTFVQAKRRQDGWLLICACTEYEKNHSYSVWGHLCYDAAGNEYEINSSSSSNSYENPQTGKWTEVAPGSFCEMIPLRDFPDDVVWLTPIFTRVTQLEIPVTIPVK
ncbi:MAG: DUF4179 domain-containing protein [Oscillospiraceae bacterium]